MSDLISSLADSIVALINDKPRSPTKAEIETALRLGLTFEQREMLADTNGARPCCGKPDLCTRPCYHRGFHAGQKSQHNTVLGDPLMPLPYKDVSTIGLMTLMEKARADMRVATSIDHLPRNDCQAEALSLKQKVDAERIRHQAAIKAGHCLVEGCVCDHTLGHPFCPNDGRGHHSWWDERGMYRCEKCGNTTVSLEQVHNS